MGWLGRVGDVGRRTLSGAASGASVGGPWGALGGGIAGAVYGTGENIAESRGWIEEGQGEGLGQMLGLGMFGQSGGGPGDEPGGGVPYIDESLFQMSPQQQAFMQQMRRQATGEAVSPWVQAAVDKIRGQQAGMAAGASSANRALAQRGAAQNVATAQQQAITQGQALAQQQYAQMAQWQNQMNMALAKLRSGQALSLQELQLMQNSQAMQADQENFRRTMSMMAGAAAGMARGMGSGGGQAGGQGQQMFGAQNFGSFT